MNETTLQEEPLDSASIIDQVMPLPSAEHCDFSSKRNKCPIPLDDRETAVSEAALNGLARDAMKLGKQLVKFRSLMGRKEPVWVLSSGIQTKFNLRDW